MDGDSDTLVMHHLYYNYENLGGLTGQWEPENSDENSRASPSPSPDSETKEKDDNENFKHNTRNCESPESPLFPRFPDIDEEQVHSPLKASAVISFCEQPQTENGTFNNNITPEELQKHFKPVPLSTASNDTAIFTVIKEEPMNDQGISEDCDDNEHDDVADKSQLDIKQYNNDDLRQLLGLNKRKKNSDKASKSHSELKKLLSKPVLSQPVSSPVISCPKVKSLVKILNANASPQEAMGYSVQIKIPNSPSGLSENCVYPRQNDMPTLPLENGKYDSYEGSNRRGRRKNIKNSRQLSRARALLPPAAPIVIAPLDDQPPHSAVNCEACQSTMCKFLQAVAPTEEIKSETVLTVTEGSDNSKGLHVCHYCNMTFHTAQKVKSHLRCHIKPFPCTVCNKSFTNSGNLKKHMRTHTGEKPYKCPLCDAAWANPSNLKRHMMKHDIHKCSSCHKDFPNSCTMTVVTERVTGNRLFVCQHCLRENNYKYLKGKQSNRPFPTA